MEMKNYSGDINRSRNGDWPCSTLNKTITIKFGRETPFKSSKEISWKGRQQDQKHRIEFGKQRCKDIDDRWISFVSGNQFWRF
jgi:hypothetical protein